MTIGQTTGVSGVEVSAPALCSVAYVDGQSGFGSLCTSPFALDRSR